MFGHVGRTYRIDQEPEIGKLSSRLSSWATVGLWDGSRRRRVIKYGVSIEVARCEARWVLYSCVFVARRREDQPFWLLTGYTTTQLTWPNTKR